MNCTSSFSLFFFFNDTATTEIYTLSLHDALPISGRPARSPMPLTPHVEPQRRTAPSNETRRKTKPRTTMNPRNAIRSEEHTSELQSLAYLVCRLLLEKKKKKKQKTQQQQDTRKRD